MSQQITVTTEPAVAPAEPVLTHYQQLAGDYIKALEQMAVILPQLEEAQVAVAKYTRGQLAYSEQFCATVIGAVEQTPELRAIGKLDPAAARNILQFLEGFKPVLDKGAAFVKNVQFTYNSQKATLVGQALQVYQIAKNMARDKRSPELMAHVANMKRDLKRPGLTKAEREQRKLAKTGKAPEKKEEIAA
jgi:hypothetical protein